jgi:hypothetical protein
MQAFAIDKSFIRTFMNHVFDQGTFFDFEVRGVAIHSFTYFEISGEKPRTGERIAYCPWGDVQPYARNIIKGGTKPRAMKIVLAKASPQALNPNAAALFININYEGEDLTCTTASSQINFDLNKAVDNEWDAWVEGFFTEQKIKFTII